MELLEEFNNLSQGDSLEEYNGRFGELRLWLLSINPYLPESYFIESYINGLTLKIKSLVKLGRPKELEEAMKLAMLHNKSATQKRATKKWIASLDKTTEAITRSQENGRVQITQKIDSAFDSLMELLWNMKGNSTASTSAGGGVVGSGVPAREESREEPKLAESQKNGVSGSWNKLESRIGFHMTSDLEFPIFGELGERDYIDWSLEKPIQEIARRLVELQHETPRPIPPVHFPTITDFPNSGWTAPNPPTLVQIASGDLGARSKEQGAAVNLSRGCIDSTIVWGINVDSKHPKIFKEFRTEFDSETPTQGLVEDPEDHPKVIIYPLELAVDIELGEIVKNQVVYTANHENLFVMEKMLLDVGINWSELVASRGTGFIIDPGITNGAIFSLKIIKDQLILMPFDRGRIVLNEANRDPFMVPFDRGKGIYNSNVSLHVQLGFGLNIRVRLIFDPGGFVEVEACLRKVAILRALYCCYCSNNCFAPDWVMIEWSDFRMISFEIFGNSVAYQVFEEMSR